MVVPAQASADAALAANTPRPVSHVRDLLPAAPRDVVALTVDDGPNPLWTAQLLDLLQRTEIRATFCLIGMHAQEYPGLVKRIIAEGHSVANHSMTHPQAFGHLPFVAIQRQITDAQSAIADVDGAAPKLFRAPCGDWSAPVLSAVQSVKLVPLGWSIDSLDCSRPGTRPIITRLLAAQPGDILLCHDGGGDRAQTLESLRIVLPAIKDLGLQFTAL
ncbi:peptidoglycan/xylan/chitin deacetylase (PgdA/CDA1 family) [Saccharopolyspora antimicrobica]|uniref:Peptidoglycan/xylan/chitin deacetylase (PgdA/CDA1 family) n=2 Tax=Saccharopolyspora antimicrobica TaxID=455193 RepID=A0ABX9TJ60_9PSEU|nr:peptidoglycan/xylan/chitin deacetylase (PgdA/CDA1 family) [Saccharopolyspora antimicrobica]